MLACDFWSLLASEIFSTSVHSTLFNSFFRAIFNTSSTFSTIVILISSLTFFGISTKSFSFSLGIITCFIPALCAASNFSFKSFPSTLFSFKPENPSTAPNWTVFSITSFLIY